MFDDDDYILRPPIQYLLHKEGPLYMGAYDEESFNFLDYKSIEWLIVRPCFYILQGDALTKKQIWYREEPKLLEILKTHRLPYEEKNGIYIIYGYR